MSSIGRQLQQPVPPQQSIPKFAVGEAVIIFPAHNLSDEYRGMQVTILERNWGGYSAVPVQSTVMTWGYKTTIAPPPIMRRGVVTEPWGWSEKNLRKKDDDEGMNFQKMAGRLFIESEEAVSCKDLECCE